MIGWKCHLGSKVMHCVKPQFKSFVIQVLYLHTRKVFTWQWCSSCNYLSYPYFENWLSSCTKVGIGVGELLQRHFVFSVFLCVKENFAIEILWNRLQKMLQTETQKYLALLILSRLNRQKKGLFLCLLHSQWSIVTCCVCCYKDCLFFFPQIVKCVLLWEPSPSHIYASYLFSHWNIGNWI